MKYLTRLGLFLLAISILARCGGKDDPKPTSKLVGKWTVTATSTKLSHGNQSFDDYLRSLGFDDESIAFYDAFMEAEYTFTGVDATFEFKADGTWTGVGTETVAGKYELSDDQKTLTLKNDAQPGVKQTCTITTLDDTNLVLKQASAVTTTDPSAAFSFDYDVTITMKRM